MPIINISAICIGVDYAIHLIYKFRSEFARLPTALQALTRTLATTGKTILFNAVVVAGYNGVAGQRHAAQSADGIAGICCHALILHRHVDGDVGADSGGATAFCVRR